MHGGKTAHYGNPFLGAFGCVTEKLAFVGGSSDKLKSACAEFLKAEALDISINGSDLAGIFMVANSSGVVFPGFVSNEELKIAKDAGLNTLVLKSRFSAIGNNIAANDKIALANPELDFESIALIKDCLGVEVIQRTIAGYKTVGAAAILTNKGFLIHNSAGGELYELEQTLSLKGGIGTANMGVPFVGMCMLANSNGYVTGEDTGGFEMHRIDEALGFQ
ncbi:MAG: translation initiation factor IF-6 [Candidatus Micrarchaeota archaeon]